MKIELATKQDVPALLDLQRKAFGPLCEELDWKDAPVLTESLEHAYEEFARYTTLKVQNDEGLIIGSVNGNVTDGSLYIGRLMVLPEYQQQGIGKQLFREIQSRLPHRHAWLCTFQQVRPPYEFYLREGFKLYKSEEVGPGLTWAYLEKSIQAPRFTFNTVGLFTNNNKATVEFYTKIFGFTTSWDGVQPNVEMFLGNNRIILFPRSAFEQMVSKRFQYPEGFNGTMELSFDVPTFADVDKEYQNTLNCGAKSVLPPTTEPWGQRTCYVADPDGNLIEIGSFVKQ